MSQVQHIAFSQVSERELLSLALLDFASLPAPLSLPAGRFIAFLAADASSVDRLLLAEFSQRLLRAGCVYFCAWGLDCERVHDVFDGECFDAEPVIMTTWHVEDSLDEALWFSVFNAFPDEGYWDTTHSLLAISVGRPDWDEHIRTKLADLDALSQATVAET